ARRARAAEARGGSSPRSSWAPATSRRRGGGRAGRPVRGGSGDDGAHHGRDRVPRLGDPRLAPRARPRPAARRARSRAQRGKPRASPAAARREPAAGARGARGRGPRRPDAPRPRALADRVRSARRARRPRDPRRGDDELQSLPRRGTPAERGRHGGGVGALPAARGGGEVRPARLRQHRVRRRRPHRPRRRGRARRRPGVPQHLRAEQVRGRGALPGGVRRAPDRDPPPVHHRRRLGHRRDLELEGALHPDGADRVVLPALAPGDAARAAAAPARLSARHRTRRLGRGRGRDALGASGCRRALPSPRRRARGQRHDRRGRDARLRGLRRAAASLSRAVEVGRRGRARGAAARAAALAACDGARGAVPPLCRRQPALRHDAPPRGRARAARLRELLPPRPRVRRAPRLRSRRVRGRGRRARRAAHGPSGRRRMTPTPSTSRPARLRTELGTAVPTGLVVGALFGVREGLLTLDANAFVQPGQYFFVYLAGAILVSMTLGVLVLVPVAGARALLGRARASGLPLYVALAVGGGTLSVVGPWLAAVVAHLNEVGFAPGPAGTVALWTAALALVAGAGVAAGGTAAWWAARTAHPLRWATRLAVALLVVLPWPLVRFVATEWKWDPPRPS